MLHFRLKGLYFLIILVIFSMACAPLKKTPELFLKYDLLIKNGFVMDGTGNPWFKADIGIKNKRIVRVGFLEEGQAKRVIDAQGLVVSPGFIDIHTHCDRGILQVPTADNYISQGVTTVIGGNCGGHPFPLQELFQKIEEKGSSVNFGVLVGHNTIKEKVMGYKMSDPTAEEMAKMKALVEEEMKAGALGFSTGLSYLPGTYSKIEEIVGLAGVAARYGGIYASHIRDQGRRITEAIEEAIEIGERNAMPVQIAHVKLADDAVWNELERITKPVEEARKRGVEVTLDQYPYTATSSGFGSSFPNWAFEGGKEKFLERLKDAEIYKKIKSHIIARRLSSTKRIDMLETIFIARSQAFPEYEGKNIKEILLLQGKEPSVETASDLIIEIEKNGGASAVFFQMDEKDVESLMRLTYLMVGSDGAMEVMGKGVPHPRNYGTFSRVIGHYVHEKSVIPLEEAIRKMTSFPAQTLKLKERGIAREGMYADLTIFDFASFKDRATFSNPHQFSQGLHYVIVNGEVVIDRGEHTGSRPGMILYGQGKSQKK